jgi:hypothetical protein
VREAITAPEYLRVRRLVHALVVFDCVCFAAVLGYVTYLEGYGLLLIGLFVAGPFLVCDLGSWTLDAEDLRRRAILGGAGIVGTVATLMSSPRARRLSLVLLAFAVLSAVSLALFPYARRVVLRHRPLHRGGGSGAGKAAIDATAKPPASGWPSGWVGRRRFF